MVSPPSSNPRRSYKTMQPGVTSTQAVSSSSLAPSVPSSTHKNMSVRKGATFHAPSTPPSDSASPTISVPSLPRRSRSCLDDVVAGRQDRIAKLISSFDRSLSGVGPLSLDAFSAEDLPVPRVYLQAMVSESELLKMNPPPKESAPGSSRSDRLRARRSGQTHKHHSSDSGIGSTESGSACSASEKRTVVNCRSLQRGSPAVLGTSVTTEDSGITVNSDSAPSITSLKLVPSTSNNRHILSSKAASAIEKYIVVPLLEAPRLKDFYPLVTGIQKRIEREEIGCLRDVEKTLIFGASGIAKSPSAFLNFCETSVLCVQDTVNHGLDERDLRLPSDRPYTDGYFVDLCEQIRQYAQMMAEARDKEASGKQLDVMDFSPTEKLVLEGGLGTTGRPVRLVRKKDGMTIPIGASAPEESSTPTDSAYLDALSKRVLKRSLSNPSLEDEDDAERSMARRRRSAEEAIPTCRECKKEFKRPCDLTKHEKTHSRPWKCSEPTCKYHELGWPTEKERDRHYNDKHSDAPAVYECQFKPCSYKSKRESNCKQHMEKAHGWVYRRTKVGKNGVKAPVPTPPTEAPTPSSDATLPTPATPSVSLSPYERPTGEQQAVHDFNASLNSGADFSGFDISGLPYNAYDASPQLDNFSNLGGGFIGQAGPSNATGLGSMPYGLSSFDVSGVNTGTAADMTGFFNEASMMAERTGSMDNFGWDLNQGPSTYNSQLLTPIHSADQFSPSTFEHMAGDLPISSAQPQQFSPGAHGDAMLYTPISEPMATMDEGVDDCMNDAGVPNGDFELFGAAPSGGYPGDGNLDLFGGNSQDPWMPPPSIYGVEDYM